MRIRQFRLVSFLLASLLFVVLGETDALADKFNTETSSSTRALGMGNAAINTERGPYAVFYNPANIAAKNTGNHVQLVNMQFDLNDPALSTLSGGKLTNAASLSSLHSTLADKPNEYVSSRFSVYPNVTFRNFSLGVLYEFNQGAELRASDNALRIRARDRFGPVAALSYRFFKGVLRLGVSSQYMTVGNAEAVRLAPFDAASLDYKESIDSAAGLVHTAGATLTLPVRFLPSFSIVARNILDTKFDKPPVTSFGNGRNVPTQPMTFDFAASMTVYLGKYIELRPEVDYRDTVNKLLGGRFRHVFAGTELLFFDFLKFRGGISHGYYTAGFGFATRQASLDFATYADEKDDRLRGSPDRRYVLQYTWGLFK